MKEIQIKNAKIEGIYYNTLTKTYIVQFLCSLDNVEEQEEVELCEISECIGKNQSVYETVKGKLYSKFAFDLGVFLGYIEEVTYIESENTVEVGSVDSLGTVALFELKVE